MPDRSAEDKEIRKWKGVGWLVLIVLGLGIWGWRSLPERISTPAQDTAIAGSAGAPKFTDADRARVLQNQIDHAAERDAAQRVTVPVFCRWNAPNLKGHGEPRIGMTEEEACHTSWGGYDTYHDTKVAGHVYRQWVFGGGSQYLYFTDGVLTAIQQ